MTIQLLISQTLSSLTENDQILAENFIIKHEGFSYFAYDDETGLRVKAPKGNLTIGHGINLAEGFSVQERDRKSVV